LARQPVFKDNIARLFDEAAASYAGINRTDARCLDIIDRYGPMTAGQVATEVRLTSGAVTAVLDRLEAVGLVRRVRQSTLAREVRLILSYNNISYTPGHDYLVERFLERLDLRPGHLDLGAAHLREVARGYVAGEQADDHDHDQ